MTQHFADRLIEAILLKKSSVCVGLDPVLDKIPGQLTAKAEGAHGPTLIAAAEAILNFNKGIIDAVYDLVPAVKPQIAFYELFGSHGMWAFEETCAYAKTKGLIVIADAKVNDIGNTAEAYSDAFLGEPKVFGKPTSMMDVDAVTVNAYLGFDGIKPFIQKCNKFGKGIFVLVKTSNVSSGDLQDRVVDKSGLRIFELLSQLVESWGSDEIGKSGFSSIGAVVGATYPKELEIARKLMPNSFFLVPGYGAQGATAKDIKGAFNEKGLGAIINSSRGVIYAYEESDMPQDYAILAREAVEKMNKEINSVIHFA
jgi:orotidine-5'-phosphate decarboxylase